MCRGGRISTVAVAKIDRNAKEIFGAQRSLQTMRYCEKKISTGSRWEKGLWIGRTASTNLKIEIVKQTSLSQDLFPDNIETSDREYGLLEELIGLYVSFEQAMKSIHF